MGKRWTGAILYVLLHGGRMRFTEIANSVGTAKEGQLLGMEIENDGSVEPDRLGHFASADHIDRDAAGLALSRRHAHERQQHHAIARCAKVTLDDE